MEDREIIENERNTECEIVKEVREIRHKISARFDHDVGRLVAHYQALETISIDIAPLRGGKSPENQRSHAF